MSPEVHADPYPFYAELRRNSPVCQIDPGGIWAITRYADVVTVLRDPQTFSSMAWTDRVSPPWLKRNPLANSLFVLDPPAHTPMRTLINPSLSSGTVDGMEPHMRAVSEELTRAVLSKTGEVEFVSEFAAPLAASAVGTVLGLPKELYPRFKSWTASVFSISANQHSPEQIATIQSDLAEMERYFTEYFDRRRAEPTNDLVSRLLAATVDGQPLSQEQMMSFLFILLPGGLETTTTVLGDTMIMLARHPDVFQRVRANHALLPRLIDEVMRFESTAHTVFRRTRRPVELSGTTIPEGAMVVCLIGAANRDEQQFPDADVFNIDREKNHHLSFGHGAHHCVGAFLGRMASRVALETLLPHIHSITLGEQGFARHHSLNARGPVSLPLHFGKEPS
ncbi:MAG: cytochrome P450 [Kofleriaceae bacterium]